MLTKFPDIRNFAISIFCIGQIIPSHWRHKGWLLFMLVREGGQMDLFVKSYISVLREILCNNDLARSNIFSSESFTKIYCLSVNCELIPLDQCSCEISGLFYETSWFITAILSMQQVNHIKKVHMRKKGCTYKWQ